MAKYEIGPTGHIVHGNLFDVKKESLERLVRSYEPRLYIKWNPKKRGGYGCYELRLRPEKKYAVPYGDFMGGKLFVAEEHEIEGEAHVYDLPVLSYSLLQKLRDGDTWRIFGRPDDTVAHQARKDQFIKELEQRERQAREDEERRLREEAIYHFTQYKSAIGDFRESILSGWNPAEMAKAWGQNKK